MGIATKDEYIDRLGKQKLRAYMAGEKIENIIDEPSSRVGINAIAISFESALTWPPSPHHLLMKRLAVGHISWKTSKMPLRRLS
jgi:aromatic ring hydroxylase